MLGHRGCRVGITFPEIYEMQVSAIFEALTELLKENVTIDLEIMIPLVSEINELKFLREKIKKIVLYICLESKLLYK